MAVSAMVATFSGERRYHGRDARATKHRHMHLALPIMLWPLVHPRLPCSFLR
jgi:hypothetical protein